MYKYIFSILLVCFAAVGKAQTIDGKLYTPFNNYYQWIGGKFNSNLNIPKVTATTGRDTGGIRYSLADSSVYVWTGSQWRAVGSSLDTTSLSNRINLKLNISDTAAMLSPYLRTNIANATFIDSVFIQNDSIKYRKNGVNIASTPADTATVVKAYVTNAEAVTITKGQVVYIFGASGDRAAVKLAKNTSDTFSSKTLGIVRADIAAGQAGWVTTQGQVSGINLGAYSPGDILWLDSVPGGFTKVKPVAPLHGVFVGVVERANVGNGLIYVKPQNGQELGELHDTKITSPTNNQVLAYTAATDIWENKTIDSSYFGGQFRTQVGAAQSVGIQWTGVDSSFYELRAENGFHHIEEFAARVSVGGFPVASQYAYTANSGGSSQGGYESGINYTIGSTGTSASSSPTIAWDAAVLQFTTDVSVWQCRIRIPTLNDGTQKYYFQIGLGAALSNPLGAAYFSYDLDGSGTGSSASANWQTITSGASNRTYNQNHTGVAVSANTWTKLKIIGTSSQVLFYVNDVLIATHTTNIPVNNLTPAFRMIKTAGIVARTYEVDYSTIDIKYNTPR